MKHNWRTNPGPSLKRPVSALLAALVLSANAGCSLGELSELAGQFREEYAPAPSNGDSGLIEGPPPPIIKPGDEKPGEETEGGAETETDLPGGETDPEPAKDPADPGESLPGTRPLTLKNAAAANEMSLLVARYGCVLTEVGTMNGWRKGYHYEIDSPGGRASVEFCDMRGTPSGCFGTLLTADGVTLYAEAQDFDNSAVSVSLSESAASFTAFENPFAPYLDGSMQVPAKTGEEGEADGIRVHCETKDGTRRADFTLDERSFEIRSITEYTEDGTAVETVYTMGAERFGADRLTAALTDYYSISPEDLTFTLQDVRQANSLTSLLASFGSAGYTLDREENGKPVRESASAYMNGGRLIEVLTVTTGGVSERRYLRDGIRYPDANGFAFRSAEETSGGDDLISSFIPDGQVGSVTVSGSSLLFTVRSVLDGVPVLARVIVEKDSLLLRSCEVDTTGTDSHSVYVLTASRGGEKTDEAIFSALGGERTVTYHIDWENAPSEDMTFPVSGGWAFRLSFLSDADYWYNAEHTDPAPDTWQAAADGMDREIWVSGAVKYVPSSDGSGLPGIAPADVTPAVLTAANQVSALTARYGSVSETGGGRTLAFQKDGGLWIRYLKDSSGESAEAGPVRMKAEDGWTSYTASYGDVVKNPDAEYAHDDAIAALLSDALKKGTLRELIPQGGAAGDRQFCVVLDGGKSVRFTADRESLALRSWQTLTDGAVTGQRDFFYGVFAGEDFMKPWDHTRTAAFHVLNAGDEVAFIRIRIPQGASLRMEMPDGWNWFFLDEALSEAAPSWIQVTAGDEDTELWVDNRNPETRTAEPSEPPAPEPEENSSEGGGD